MTDKPCEHQWVTSTRALGPHCSDCKEPLVGILTPISRNTVGGALMYAMKQHPRRTNPMTDKLIEALKPCPFCGAQPEHADVQQQGVVCPSCGVEGPLGYHDGRRSAVAGWNQRAHRSQQEAAQEPVAVVESIGGPKSLPQLLWYVGFPRIGVMVKPGDKLYTAPSESEARKPLTDAEIRDESGKWINQPDHISSPDPFKAGVRWAEKQHGITDAALSASGQKGEPT